MISFKKIKLFFTSPLYIDLRKNIYTYIHSLKSFNFYLKYYLIIFKQASLSYYFVYSVIIYFTILFIFTRFRNFIYH